MVEGELCEKLRTRFVRSFLDAVILHMLSGEQLWGYRMMTMLREDHGVKVGPPVIYPLLDSMEVDGLIEGSEVYDGKRRRKIYSATNKGSDYLRCLEKILSELVE
ncbi:MAG: PadR family transcriptional regulator [Candidatus Bathyarchaeota archaeon]|nr:PadR family transcriptional regulator [Candidatus Bathyarchaeota archaeon]